MLVTRYSWLQLFGIAVNLLLLNCLAAKVKEGDDLLSPKKLESEIANALPKSASTNVLPIKAINLIITNYRSLLNIEQKQKNQATGDLNLVQECLNKLDSTSVAILTSSSFKNNLITTAINNLINKLDAKVWNILVRWIDEMPISSLGSYESTKQTMNILKNEQLMNLLKANLPLAIGLVSDDILLFNANLVCDKVFDISHNDLLPSITYLNKILFKRLGDWPRISTNVKFLRQYYHMSLICDNLKEENLVRANIENFDIITDLEEDEEIISLRSKFQSIIYILNELFQDPESDILGLFNLSKWVNKAKEFMTKAFRLNNSDSLYDIFLNEKIHVCNDEEITIIRSQSEIQCYLSQILRELKIQKKQAPLLSTINDILASSSLDTNIKSSHPHRGTIKKTYPRSDEQRCKIINFHPIITSFDSEAMHIFKNKGLTSKVRNAFLEKHADNLISIFDYHIVKSLCQQLEKLIPQADETIKNDIVDKLRKKLGIKLENYKYSIKS